MTDGGGFDLIERLARGETPGTEFKGPGRRSDKAFAVKVARAALAMANRRDGGVVVLGVDDARPLASPGLSADELAEWMDRDRLGDLWGTYCDGAMDVEPRRVDLDGKVFVVLFVAEFATVPILCRQDYPGTLIRGACYVRAHGGRVESRPIRTEVEMRQLIDLAADKRLAAYVASAHRAGTALIPADRAVEPTDDELFDQELGGLA